MLFVVCCLLLVVGCVVDCCVLFVVCCLLCVDCCVLFVVCCLLAVRIWTVGCLFVVG